ncbi:hypothetical protein Taro_005997 [Colocasia esculenta]|uniref:Uncharacterized protein n=1 Tax=Colocasia esculenta TaxID=4460 RepID=A0A843TRG2_COLES|nr:hypothetical protein [Colocasia esculenta]
MAAQFNTLLAMDIFDLAASLRPADFSPVRHGASTVARYKSSSASIVSFVDFVMQHFKEYALNYNVYKVKIDDVII